MAESPIQESVDRLVSAMQAGSGKAYDELYEFVRHMILNSVNSWPIHLAKRSDAYITSHPECFTTPHELVRLTRRLHWETFRAMWGPVTSASLRELLCCFMVRFGKPYIADLSRCIADTMAVIEDDLNNGRRNASEERPHREAEHSIYDPL
jgi:hypothetical protein